MLLLLHVTSYTATIPYNVTVCKAYTRTEDKDAKVNVEGSSDMKVGKNKKGENNFEGYNNQILINLKTILQ